MPFCRALPSEQKYVQEYGYKLCGAATHAKIDALMTFVKEREVEIRSNILK